LTQKEWYHKKGIPHTLGFMFHGEPGCGKTSAIKAISNVAHRHVINLQLSEIKTKQQLRHLFFNDEINVFNGQTTERYTIPVSERMFVVEDVDAMGDAVLRRELKQPVEPKQDNWDQMDEEFNSKIKEKNIVKIHSKYYKALNVHTIDEKEINTMEIILKELSELRTKIIDVFRKVKEYC
jgi:DNA polymerase III delta prime subunit